MKIAIDGPAGAGKSTVAKALAKQLHINYLDTGAMYRGIAYALLQKGVNLKDQNAVAEQVDGLDMQVIYNEEGQRIIVDGQDITPYIRSQEVTIGSSDVAVVREVRVKLVDLQRKVAQKFDVVMDGRDIGTHVLPDADVKFYITASAKERAKRRFLENQQKGIESDLEQIEKDILYRDEQDSNREFAPLRQADDAIYIDTTSLSLPQVLECVKEHIEKVCGGVR